MTDKTLHFNSHNFCINSNPTSDVFLIKKWHLYLSICLILGIILIINIGIISTLCCSCTRLSEQVSNNVQRFKRLTSKNMMTDINNDLIQPFRCDCEHQSK